MTSARAEARPRAGAGGAWWPALGIAAIWIFLGVFLVYPLARIFYDAFSDDAGRLTVRHFVDFATDGFYRRSLWNSLVLGLGTVAATSVLGFAIAMLLVRYDFVGRSLFSNLTLIPIVAPPLVGVLGFTFILGRAGTVNVLLMDWFDLLTPINFVYGVHGVLLVETLHLFPMITLNVVDALAKIDPALEDAAESVGACGWWKLATITLPLTTPGYVAGALLVFIWTFSDFATPLVLGVHDLLASQAYLNIVQFVDRRLFRMGIVISALMVVLALVFLLAARHYVAIKDYSSLSYSRIVRRKLGPLGQTAVIAFLSCHVDIPGFGRALTSFWVIIPIVLAVRRLPYTVRGTYASLLLVHRSMEEAAASVGATGLRSFRDVTLPLIWRGVLVGSLFSFMTSLQEASAVLFLSLGGWETIPVGIFAFYIAGSANEAAALGVILIAVATVSVLAINRIAGTRMGGMFG